MKNFDTSYPIADLHCDLLCYLSRNPSHTPYDLSVRCAIPQLQEGNVKLQVMAIFTDTTPQFVSKGLAQAEVFKSLSKNYPTIFRNIKTIDHLDLASETSIAILPALENASSLCDENENLDDSLKRLSKIQHMTGKFAYISLTWNTENRFGGGAYTTVGLRNDGKKLIDYMHENRITLDLSHASDHLVEEILNYIDKNKIPLALIASHSNVRAVVNHPRNLPNDLIKEIFNRKGIIGMNFIRHSENDTPNTFVAYMEHLLLLGGERKICFGADFYDPSDLPAAYKKKTYDSFFPDFSNASSYPRMINLFKNHLTITPQMLSQICSTNVIDFLKTNYF